MMSAVAKALEVASKLIVVVISPHSEFLKFSFAFPEVEPSIHSNGMFPPSPFPSPPSSSSSFFALYSC